ncbi:MAG TPA: hypothetical protein VFS17_02295 [Methylophilaceae bacterium]|nr:hypothetical protein [Methylophilaceae bacterium]
MIFDIYKRFELEIVRVNGRWVVYRLGNGTKRADWTIVVPHELKEDELVSFLDDFYHEYARPGDSITCR